MLKQSRMRPGLAGLALIFSPLATQAAHPNFSEAEIDVVYSLVGEQPTDSYGWVADPIGDIDFDGRPDFITSAPFFVDGGGNNTGKAYIHSGADGSLLHEIQGNPGESLGFAATQAGDVDGDGIGDYVIGTQTRAMVHSGADHSVIHEWIQPGELFGYDAAGLGDLNGDGYGEVAIGAPVAGYGGPTSGRLYVFSGIDGSVLWAFDGQPGWLTGLGVGPVGDQDGDGVDDVVVAAHGAVANGKGAVLVLSGADGSVLRQLKSRSPSPSANFLTTFGRFHTHGAGDVNGDGIDDIFVGDYNAKSPEDTPDGSPGFGTGRAYVYSGANGRILHDIRAEQVGDGMGPGRGVPDVNGDGQADIYVAAYTYTDGALPSVGKGYLISGADGEVLRTMTGQTPNELLGVDALGMGDVTGDGLADYMITGNSVIYVIAGN